MKSLKRKYSKPFIEVFNMDKEICLVMTSENTGPGDGFESASAQVTPEGTSSIQDNPFEENNLK